jgi:GNAT superfamily N-acetyltransferase
MEIREADKHDLDSLVDCMTNMADFARESLGDPYLDDMNMDQEKALLPWFRKTIENQDAIVYVADQGGTLAGFVIGNLSKPFVETKTIDRIGRIEVCWVEPEFRKKGLTRQLIEQIESWFKGRGAKYVELYYLEKNLEAKQVWTHLGFEPFRISSRKKL